MATDMDQPLFSDAPAPEASTPSTPPPDRVVTTTVPADQTTAFEGFTEYLHLWWPHEHTNFGDESHPYFSETEIAEESEDGATQVWANIDDFTPPELIQLAWTLGANPESPTEVVIEFEPADGATTATTVTLTHRGWAPGSEGWDQYRKYSDWPHILGAYAHFMGASPAPAPVD
ncbi:SRPBCC domain-containing protein [Haematomicrobium sanguinis]|uniref:SRPBCC domain-containing protein n=1 Tax=Haematomicrobium sanguinis TaxID=479106 RepID=UPI0012FBA895|nr:SRPBCC domain-containing protein [Haematomicrobium sanguinis]